MFNNAVLHGGTAIWRGYSGKRFSEDLDFYLPRDRQKIELIFDNLKKLGFEIKKKKISENSLYSELEFDRTSVRFEALFKNVKGIIGDYETSSGNYISIYSLTYEQFLIEKTKTYLKRFKIRDLWDVFFLLKYAKDITNLKEKILLIKNYKKPLDEKDLKIILLEGIIPSSEEMINYIKRKWENKYI